MNPTPNDSVQRIALELSLKPFGRDNGVSYAARARQVIMAWRPLLEAASEVSFVLWVADGSEILEWRGDMAQSLEWARYIGFCNRAYGVYAAGHHPPSRDAIPYAESPRPMRYADLQEIVAALRAVGAELLGRRITIGATFDPGPEFAESPFKYERHREIIVPQRVSGRPTFPMADAGATLDADPQSYAAYPKGIPQGEPFALFLGRQIAAFCRDLDFDYVWLSNGFGFSAVAWDYLGPGFDGERFLPEARAEQLTRFKRAWEALHSGNPDVPMEVRGSNFAAGMDIAKDGVDFAWLYETGYIRLPPPNSPWGVLNFDYGLEIAGFLSRAVRSPRGQYLFRYYPNDPWFWQNPWTDIFYGEAYDIYVPLATGVIGAAGEITTPSAINILTGDTEFGEVDPLTGVQVGAHIRTALSHRPDDVGLVTWIYPFEAYHQLAARDAAGQAEVFFGDWFVRSAINNGLPVATVGTPAAFDARVGKPGPPPETVAFLPSAAVHTAEGAARLLAWLARGIPAIVYGPASSLHPALLRRLGLELDDPLHGEMVLRCLDGPGGLLVHDPIGSAGPIRAKFVGDREAGGKVTLRYSVAAGAATRAYCVASAAAGDGSLIWIRGTNPFETRPDKTRLALKPRPRDDRWFDASRLCVEALGRLGYTIDVLDDLPPRTGLSQTMEPSRTVEPSAALMLFARHDNAWFLSGYSAAPVGFARFRFPAGAPIFHTTFSRIEDGAAHYPLARTMHQECRVFVRQRRGVVGCDPRARNEHHRVLTLRITGLVDATVTFLPPPGMAVTFEHAGRQTRFSPSETSVSQSGLSGELLIHW